MIRKYRYVGTAIACVSLNNPVRDLVLHPNQVYQLDREDRVVRGWFKKGLLKEEIN
ncbi:hypothetical protein [Geminocystis sp. NIES-3709]|uniref:hypothetical protein n=1 Tax=Geminocystis sp. NIES-3709 TaxID=1617448 RepID=UPI0005FC8727|nr:hypothetical protein [Geminocystis sp. NIES-3709]BAQ65523.1 hypothetical protein GM3709_2288 [Geminocystis sp. NIES-3709]